MVNLGKKDLFFLESIRELLLPARLVINRLAQFLLGRGELLTCNIEIVMPPFQFIICVFAFSDIFNTVYTSEGVGLTITKHNDRVNADPMVHV
ncbi:MAG: hypothetical protein WCF90_09750 [Methanomicrobiales archaeon]